MIRLFSGFSVKLDINQRHPIQHSRKTPQEARSPVPHRIRALHGNQVPQQDSQWIASELNSLTVSLYLKSRKLWNQLARTSSAVFTTL